MAGKTINEQLIRVVAPLGASYILNGHPISLEEIFANSSLLPAIVRRADQLASLCLGYGIGVKFENAKNTKLGIKAIFDDVTPQALRYLCVIDVMSELIKASPSISAVSLDELLYD